MKRTGLLIALLFSTTAIPFAQNPPTTGTQTAPPAGGRQGGGRQQQPPRMPPLEFFSKNTPPNLVEYEMMTWPEVYRAIHEQGKTTALFYIGGTEHRGPQNVNGGHNVIGRAVAKAIALKLGNAIAMPVLPYSPNNASAQQTGTIGLTPEILSTVLERLAEQAIANGFKNVVLMGDHGGGQPGAYKSVADKLETKYAELAATQNRPQDVHVYYCDEVYSKAGDDFDKYLESVNLPVSGHAGIPDTSAMMYLQGKTQEYTRLDLLPVAMPVGGPTAPRGQRGGQAGAAATPPTPTPDPSTPRPVASGVNGDGRKSSVELGKRVFDNKVENAVRQITAFIAAQKK